MDWKVLLSTFGLIFMAEMGDKTQLAAITMVAKTKAPWAVFIGASLAMTIVSFIGVFAGMILLRYVPTEALEKAAAIAFILIGVLMLWGKW